MKLIVCVSCEAEFAIKHNMDDYHYRIMYCPFCGSDIDDPDFEDEMIGDIITIPRIKEIIVQTLNFQQKSFDCIIN